MIGGRREVGHLLLAPGTAARARACRCGRRSSRGSRRRSGRPCIQPFDSLAVRWQQRSFSAAGLPSSSRNSTMSSPSSRNGFGPSGRSSSGITAYQNRRSTFCWVVSIERLVGLRDKYQVSFSTALSCHEPSASLDRPTISRNKSDAGDRDQEQRGEHARDFELEAGLQDLVGEAGVAPAGAGDELGHHRADQRQPARQCAGRRRRTAARSGCAGTSASAAARRG